MVRDKSYYRYQRNKAINRKFNILKRLREPQELEEFEEIYRKKGKLSKGKIHCSCYMCRNKSYDELSHRDKKRKHTEEDY